MKVNIICVGKIKEKYISEGIAEYQKRLSKFYDIKVIEVDEFSQEKSITKKNCKWKQFNYRKVIRLYNYSW